MAIIISENDYVVINNTSWKKDKSISISESSDLDTVLVSFDNGDDLLISYSEHGSDNGVNSYNDFLYFIKNTFKNESSGSSGGDSSSGDVVIKDSDRNALKINPDGSIDVNNLSNLSKISLLKNLSDDLNTTFEINDLGDGVMNYTRVNYSGTVNGVSITAHTDINYTEIDGVYHVTSKTDNNE